MATTNNEILRHARMIRRFADLSAVGCALATMVALWQPSGLGPVQASALVMGADTPPHAWIPAVWALTFFVGMLSLRRAMRALEDGELFGLAVVRPLKAFAFAMLTLGGWSVVSPALANLIQSAGAGSISLTLSLSSADLAWFLIGMLVYLLIQLLIAAARYRDDSEAII